MKHSSFSPPFRIHSASDGLGNTLSHSQLNSMPYNTRRAHYDLFSFNHRKNTHTHRQYIYHMVGDFDEGRKNSLKCFMWNNWALHDRFCCCCCCFGNWFGMICDQGVVEDLRTTKEKQTIDSALKSTMPHTNSAYLYKRCMPREKWIRNGIFISAAFCFASTQPHTHANADVFRCQNKMTKLKHWRK